MVINWEHILYIFCEINLGWYECQYSVNIGSDNGLVRADNMPWPEPNWIQIYVNIRPHNATLS